MGCKRRVAAGNMDRMEVSLHNPFFLKASFFLACPNEACTIEDLIKMEKNNFAILNM